MPASELFAAPAVMRPPGPRLPLSFRIALNAMVGLLGLQFLLGMAVTLYVGSQSLPSSAFGALNGGGGSSAVLVAGHVVIGAVLGALGLALIPWSYRLGRGRVLGGCVAGGVAVWVAAAAGASFLANHQPPGDSFAMAVGFLAAFWAYFWTRVQAERLGSA